MSELLRTPLYDNHLKSGAKMVEFGGWDMPVFYQPGIVTEHLTTRKGAGLFDVSHMGRFTLRGSGALNFLQHVLTNNTEALAPLMSQYTIIPNPNGGAVDDAYLYRFFEDRYMLVVNAANRLKDWDHLQQLLPAFPDVELEDATFKLAMIAVQGPESERIIREIFPEPYPAPKRNALSVTTWNGSDVLMSRTGYTGEPICFELFVRSEDGPPLWDLLIEHGASPTGLGARDTLRLEAALPLYGHEFGEDPGGSEIPIMACALAKFAVSLSPAKGDFVGREALTRQFEAYKRFAEKDYSLIQDLPRVIKPFAMVGRGVGRAGANLFKNDAQVGWVTSGTTVPMWVFEGEGTSVKITDQQKLRAIGLAMMDSNVVVGDTLLVEIRKKQVEAVVVPYHMRGNKPPYVLPVVHGE